VREAFQIIFNGQLNDEQAFFSAEREHGGGVSGGGRRARRLCEETDGDGCFFRDDGAGECTSFGLLFASSARVC
jgi:hypothetical protein